MAKPRIKNFFPDANVIQIQLEGYEIVVHKDKVGDIYVDVREFATGEETNLILGEASPKAPIQN